MTYVNNFRIRLLAPHILKEGVYNIVKRIVPTLTPLSAYTKSNSSL